MGIGIRLAAEKGRSFTGILSTPHIDPNSIWMQVSSWQGQNTKFPQLVAVTVVDYNHHPIKLNYLSSRIGFMGLSSYVLAVLAMIHPASAWLIPSELPLMWCSISVATWSQPSPAEMARMDGVLYREDVMTGDFTHQVHERPQWPTTSWRCGGDHICGWSWYHMTYESYEQHRRRGVRFTMVDPHLVAISWGTLTAWY